MWLDLRQIPKHRAIARIGYDDVQLGDSMFGLDEPDGISCISVRHGVDFDDE